MSKHHVVLFGSNGARIITTQDVSHFQGMPNALIDPDLEAVKGIPPHHWQLQDSKVVPTPEEQRTDPNQPSIVQHTITVAKSHYVKLFAIVVGVSTVVSLLVKFLL